MTNSDLLKRVRGKAYELQTAFDTTQTAYLKHSAALKAWADDRSQQTAHALVTTEGDWDTARDSVIANAQSLLDLTQEFLLTIDPSQHKLLRKRTTTLHEAVIDEASSFLAYFNASGGSKAKREIWQQSRSDLMAASWPVMESWLAMDAAQLTVVGWHASQYFEQKEGLEAKGKPQTPPPPDPLAVRDLSTDDTDLDGTLAHNS